MKGSKMIKSNNRHSVATTTGLGLAIMVMAVSWLFTALEATAASGVISYQANQNPTNQDGYVTQPGNQFWTRSASGAAPVGTGIVDGVTLAWAVDRATVGVGEEFWTETPLAADAATGNVQGWKLSTRLRLPSTGRAPSTGAMVNYTDGSKDWQMWFGTAANGDPMVLLNNGTTNPSFTLTGAGNTGYHDYLLAYNPNELNADLYVDGGLAISDFAPSSAGFTRLLFGDASNGGTDQNARYNSVLLVLPEPTTVMLIVAGGATLLVARRRSRD